MLLCKVSSAAELLRTTAADEQSRRLLAVVSGLCAGASLFGVSQNAADAQQAAATLCCGSSASNAQDYVDGMAIGISLSSGK